MHELCIYELIELGSFATLLFLRLDMQSAQLSMVDCGHPPVIHFHASTGKCTLLKGENLPLGLIEHQEYHAMSFPVQPDDILVLYSDGISESFSPDQEMFGNEQLTGLIESNHMLPAQAIIEKIQTTLSGFAGREIFDDDVTCIVIRFWPSITV